jgi:CPA1 family monovalent cation:H+ antiporter
MEGFLSALLFAGAVHIDLSEIAARKWAITLMATVGVLISTFLVGGAIWFVARFLEFDLPFIWALVFGALISPTDPVAVLGILKTVHVPPLLSAKIAGESLFNDGVGVVIFTIMVALALGTGHGAGEFGAIQVAGLFIAEAFGGAALGLVCGLIAFLLMYSLDEHNLEIMITLALVTGAYTVALHLHVSGPIAMVVSGLLIGNQGARLAMSEKTRRHVFEFWELTDEILNSVLFLLIGLEVLVIRPSLEHAWLALAAIPIVLAARWVSVSVPIGLMAIRERFTRGAIRILTWGGLRGGISVALALSLPAVAYKAPILTATYAVVVFSIIVQGLTMKPLVRRIMANETVPSPEAVEPQTK